MALCISGGLRNFKDTHYSFVKYLLSKHEVDVFFYGLENKEGKENNINDFKNLYNPKNCIVNSKDYYENINFPYKESSCCAFYNIYMCNELKKSYENLNNFKYDYVIRSRADIFWFRYISDDEFNLANDSILIPQEWAFKAPSRPYARSDMFALGNSMLIDAYSSLFTRINEYINEIGTHPESLCGYHILKNSIPNIENERCFVFEYPSKRTEKYIHPYKHFKHFEEPEIENENEFLRFVTEKRKTY